MIEQRIVGSKGPGAIGKDSINIMEQQNENCRVMLTVACVDLKSNHCRHIKHQIADEQSC